VQPTAKAWFIEQLDWLAEAQPLAWHFRNTAALAAELPKFDAPLP
jgi:hypothetical protein